MDNERSKYLNAVSQAEDHILKAMEVNTPPLIDDTSTITKESANLTSTNDGVMLEILRLLKKMDNKDSQTKCKRDNDNNDSNKNNNNNGNNNNYCNNNKNNDCHNNYCNNNNNDDRHQQKRTRYDTTHYCHTHGACGHEGKHCKKRGNGHKDEATFKNRMGASIDFCQVCT